MRLLHTETIRLESFDCDEVAPKYAILSHRWMKEEVTLEDMRNGRAEELEGWTKIQACCRLALSRGHEYVWIDTCCIDKSSSAELQEAINSMYRWYEEAQECYAYLADVKGEDLEDTTTKIEFSSSVWFKRGWTLQELIAPRIVLFLNQNWGLLGEKSSLCSILSEVSRIDRAVLARKRSPLECPVAQRMAWAADRTTTRVEDKAYSLLGLFEVYMPMLYGEGKRAFQRLQEEIIKHSDDHTLFAWSNSDFAKSVLAPDPSCFKAAQKLFRIDPRNDTSQGYYSLVNAGLSIQLQLVPWSMKTYLAPLRCGHLSAMTSQDSLRRYDRACIFLQLTDHESQFLRVSVDGKDMILLNGDEIADMRDRFGYPDRQILIRHLSPSSHIQPFKECFYGYDLTFDPLSKFFSEGCHPRSRDVVCAHRWDPENPKLWIRNGTHDSAGMFHLSELYAKLYMYLGFDRDFSPLCLISLRHPNSSRFKISRPGSYEAEARRFLDLHWLRTQIEHNECAATEVNLLAFRGDRRKRMVVECSGLPMRLVFQWCYSDLSKMYGWHVHISDSEQAVKPSLEPSTRIELRRRSSGRIVSGKSSPVRRDQGSADGDVPEFYADPAYRSRPDSSGRNGENRPSISGTQDKRHIPTNNEVFRAGEGTHDARSLLSHETRTQRGSFGNFNFAIASAGDLVTSEDDFNLPGDTTPPPKRRPNAIDKDAAQNYFNGGSGYSFFGVEVYDDPLTPALRTGAGDYE